MTFGTPSRIRRLKLASLVCGLALLAPVAAAISHTATENTANASTVNAADANLGTAPTSTLDDGLHW